MNNKTPLILAVGGVAVAAIIVFFVLPAETGYDPTGVGEATGLTEIANPENAEFERGQARMATQDVLLLGADAPAVTEGVSDSWEIELAPFESVEFKYEIAEGQPMAFRWEATGPVNYDMHSHPYEGGVEMTESYSIDEAQVMEGTYIPAFTGIHGWFWENRSMDNVTLRLEATGAMTHSTVFGSTAVQERPIEGAGPRPEGSAEGHEMQAGE